ncbi:hypothetical protein CRG98_041229 [Punica granatum]|uniref:Uncharacterized protein n=1 Tax=Punica granatum TaxID=22663 RepID=A0A2I0I309_PUNGR|nr:hypothetical protein CRG98_041229 [Punica granatum]
MSLTQFLTDPDLVLFNKLLPSNEFVIGEFPEPTHTVNIQVNVFRCGGIALGICNTHRLHDGIALGVFLKEWAAVGRGSGGGSGSSEVAPQDLKVAAELFPANDLWLRDSSKIMFNSICRPGNSATKRPIWVSPVWECKMMFFNSIFLVDTRSGEGIEAWVIMDEQEMALLQEDPELRAFANVSDQGLNSKEFGLVVRKSLSIHSIPGSKPLGAIGEPLACLPIPCAAGGSGSLRD